MLTMQASLINTDRPVSLAVPQGPLTINDRKPPSIGLSLVLPTFQEASNIEPALLAISETLRKADGLKFEIIVVDDNSPDGTADLALRATLRLPHVRVMRRTGEAGLATAVVRGWQASRGEILAVMDADLQHPPSVLIELLAAMRQGSDMAIASRHVEGGGVSDWKLARRCISRVAQAIGFLLLPEVVGRVRDPMSGYFMVRREVIAGRRFNPTGYKILLELLARAKPTRISEVGYVFQERQKGASKVTTRVYLQYFVHLLRLRLGSLFPFSSTGCM